MDLQELKDKKKELEEQIEKLVCDFSEKHGVNISMIGYSVSSTVFDDVKGKLNVPVSATVKINIQI